MTIDFVFILNSVLLGFGLAMDAFSVSLANGLNEPEMNSGRMNLIAGTYGFFQFIMPVIGWVCVKTVLNWFNVFRKAIPFIALGLLSYIGGKMLCEAFKKKEDKEESSSGKICFSQIVIQGIATSIDALSVGFTISEYNFAMALLASLIIAVVTYILCIIGVEIGKKFGVKLQNKASVLGGIVLIGIGLEIFIKGVFF